MPNFSTQFGVTLTICCAGQFCVSGHDSTYQKDLGCLRLFQPEHGLQLRYVLLDSPAAVDTSFCCL